MGAKRLDKDVCAAFDGAETLNTKGAHTKIDTGLDNVQGRQTFAHGLLPGDLGRKVPGRVPSCSPSDGIRIAVN